MKRTNVIAALLYCITCLPIWFYLLYQILVRINASELMFFLFWIYLPLSLVLFVIIKLTDQD